MSRAVSDPAMMHPAAARPPKVGWLAALSPHYLIKPSALMLLAVNVLPLVGVVYWNWDLFTLMMLYWMETAIIGFFSIIQVAVSARWFALFFVPFFTLHFGGFMAGHFVFLASLFGDGKVSDSLEKIPETLQTVLDEYGLWIAAFALLVSHGFSFVLNFLMPLIKQGRAHLGNSEHSAGAAMGGAYGRVIVMHATLLIGAALALYFGSKTAAFALLIVLKTAVDLAAHVRKNFRPTD